MKRPLERTVASRAPIHVTCDDSSHHSKPKDEDYFSCDIDYLIALELSRELRLTDDTGIGTRRQAL
jgi:hypothetical protein